MCSCWPTTEPSSQHHPSQAGVSVDHPSRVSGCAYPLGAENRTRGAGNNPIITLAFMKEQKMGTEACISTQCLFDTERLLVKVGVDPKSQDDIRQSQDWRPVD
jgi:hypothetical protein